MSVDTWIRLWRAGFAISFFGATQFLVCVILAGVFYPGGNFDQMDQAGYSMGRNFVSDLGRSVSLSGDDNDVGGRIFGGSMIVFGVSLLPWFLFMPMQAWDRPVSLTVAAIAGAIASVALVVAGFHPVDLYPATHHLALFVWVIGIFFSASIHALAMLTSRENLTVVLPLVSVAVAMLAIAYGISATETAAAFVFHRPAVPLKSVLLEKLVFLAVMIWVFTFSARMLLTTDFSEYLESQSESEADYFRELEDDPFRRGGRSPGR